MGSIQTEWPNQNRANENLQRNGLPFNGPNVVKINGNSTYMASGVFPTADQTPRHAQLFCLPPDEAVDLRAESNMLPEGTQKDLLAAFHKALMEENPLADAYKSAHEVYMAQCAANPGKPPPMFKLVLLTNREASDLGENDPSVHVHRTAKPVGGGMQQVCLIGVLSA